MATCQVSSRALQEIMGLFLVLGFWLSELCFGPAGGEFEFSLFVVHDGDQLRLGGALSATDPERQNQSRLPVQWLDNKLLKGSFPNHGDNTV